MTNRGKAIRLSVLVAMGIGIATITSWTRYPDIHQTIAQITAPSLPPAEKDLVRELTKLTGTLGTGVTIMDLKQRQGDIAAAMSYAVASTRRPLPEKVMRVVPAIDEAI